MTGVMLSDSNTVPSATLLKMTGLLLYYVDVAKKVLDNCGMKSEDGESPHEFLQDFRDSQPYRYV